MHPDDLRTKHSDHCSFGATGRHPICARPGKVSSSQYEKAESCPVSMAMPMRMRMAPARSWSARPIRPKALRRARSEEHTSELQSLMRISYAVFCLKKQKTDQPQQQSIESIQYTNHQTTN